MRPKELILRGLAERKEGVWQAFCLDLSLAAQGETFDEAMAKLESQVKEYLYDALEGEDKEHASYLLSRSAPASLWLKYYSVKITNVIQALWMHNKAPAPTHKAFQKPMPVTVGC